MDTSLGMTKAMHEGEEVEVGDVAGKAMHIRAMRMKTLHGQGGVRVKRHKVSSIEAETLVLGRSEAGLRGEEILGSHPQRRRFGFGHLVFVALKPFCCNSGPLLRLYVSLHLNLRRRRRPNHNHAQHQCLNRMLPELRLHMFLHQDRL